MIRVKLIKYNICIVYCRFRSWGRSDMKYEIGSRYLSGQLKKRPHNHPTHNAKAGEVWIANDMKFEGSEGHKDRPIIIVSVNGGSIKCYHCTSQISSIRKRSEILDLASAGLEKRTYVDLELHTISSNKLSHKLGELSDEDRDILHIG